jgi:hypothetical protein
LEQNNLNEDEVVVEIDPSNVPIQNIIQNARRSSTKTIYNNLKEFSKKPKCKSYFRMLMQSVVICSIIYLTVIGITIKYSIDNEFE